MNDKAYKFSTRDDTTFRVEAGAGSGIMIVEAEPGEGFPPSLTLKKTWQEIYDATKAGTPVFLSFSPGEGSVVMYLIQGVLSTGGIYTVTCDILEFVADTSDGYPTNAASGQPDLPGF